MSQTKKPFIALRNALAREIAPITHVDPDHAPYADKLHFCFVELDFVNHDYLSNIGTFSYMLTTQARNDDERENLTRFCTLLLEHLVYFHMVENEIEIPD